MAAELNELFQQTHQHRQPESENESEGKSLQAVQYLSIDSRTGQEKKLYYMPVTKHNYSRSIVQMKSSCFGTFVLFLALLNGI